MKARVDKNVCTGCGLCVNNCPDVFEMQGDVAGVKGESIPDSAVECAKEAAGNCPLDAIVVE